MAEGLVLSVVGRIISTLASPALQKIGASWGVKDDLNKLKLTLMNLKAVLADAEERYYYSDPVKVWLKQIRDVVYEAQDLLDEFSMEVVRLRLRSQNRLLKPIQTFFSSSNPIVFRLKMGPRVRAVRERLESAAANRRFHFEERTVKVPDVMEIRRSELSHGFIRDGDIVGREDDKKAILGLLLYSSVCEDVSILSIVGIAGAGKTTLAKYVYQDEAVKNHFDLKIWVYVSDEFDAKRILRSIIADGGDGDLERNEADMNRLQQKLHKKLDGRKFLIVLDDLWNEDHERWTNLKSLLSIGASGSKILITTRTDAVAEITSTVPPYHLGSLSESMSLDLFMRMALKDGKDVTDPEFVAIGEKIAEKCYGVPLALRVMGSLMLSKRSKAEWLYVLDHELARMEPLNNSDVMPIVELSYRHLPSHLKQCFAYCSLFPKDFKIKKVTLLNVWIAHGLIQAPEEKSDVEDIAEEYFRYLLWRNFFQDENLDSDGNIISCKMHDLMNDLARSVGGTGFVSLSGHGGKIDQSTYHVSFSTIAEVVEVLPELLYKARNLRTLFSTASPWCGSVNMPKSCIDKAILDGIMRFQSLRVLDLHDMNIEEVPCSIGKLIHLRYLDLSGNAELKRLPGSIAKLHNLLVLNLFYCFKLEELPGDLRLLPSLRFLDISLCLKLQFLPRGLRELTSLSTLTRFILADRSHERRRHSRLSDLSCLDNLRGELMIENLPHDRKTVSDAKAAELRKKQHLHTLGLSWKPLQGDEPANAIMDGWILDGLQPNTGIRRLFIGGFSARRFQSWMRDIWESLPNLTGIHLENCMNCESLPPLGQLPHLKSLRLGCLPKVEYIEGIISQPAEYSERRQELATLSAVSGPLGRHHPNASLSFPCLVELWIEDCAKLKFIPFCPNLEILRIGKVGPDLLKQSFKFQRLKCLHIRQIDEMKYVPEEWLRNLGLLEHLYLEKCPDMTRLSRGMRHLTRLQELWIWDCEQLDLSMDEYDDPMRLEGLEDMQKLTIRKVPKMVSLSDWLLDVFNLNHLSIIDCSGLMVLPERIEEMGSLQRLDVIRCPSLTYLPEGIRRMKSLNALRIAGCPNLERACDREGGKDWNKIAHVTRYTNNLYVHEGEMGDDMDHIVFRYV